MLPGGPVRKLYLLYRLARLQRLAESIPGFLNCLQIWGLERVPSKVSPGMYSNAYGYINIAGGQNYIRETTVILEDNAIKLNIALHLTG